MSVNTKMRIYHRYLGFFLAGIMTVYAVSGIVLIFRDTDFLKKEKKMEKKLAPALNAEALGKEIKIRELKVENETADVMTFKQGTYNKQTGEASWKVKELPYVMTQLTKLHKANSKSPLFFLNVFFGLSLFFFVISSFWMFMPKTAIFKKGLYFTIAGVVLTVVLLFI